MSEALPEPLTPADCDLQDFPFMPLHVARLRDSDMAVEEQPEACWYAVLLWSASWHQLPAGSLPDNDTFFMRICGLGRDERTWRRFRQGALRGFIRCSDGRLYHPVVAEQVRDAWDSKLRQRHRNFCAAIRKHNERHADDKRDAPDFDTWLSQGRPDTIARPVTQVSRVTGENVTRDIASKRQGQGQGQGYIQTQDPVACGTDARGENREVDRSESLPAKLEPPPKPARAAQPPPDPDDPVLRVMDAAGMPVRPPDARLVQDWLALPNTELERDILPVIRSVAARVLAETGRKPFRFKLFDEPIRTKWAEDEAEIQRLRSISRRYADDPQPVAQPGTVP